MIAGKEVRRRRLALGISSRELGRRVGTSAGVVERIEGGRSTELSLAQADRLAAALGVSLIALLGEEPELPAVDEDAVRRVGACLAEQAGKPVQFRELARRCGIELEDVRSVLARLALQLESVGMTLSYAPRSVSLAAADIPPLAAAAAPLTGHDLALLAEAANGPIPARATSSGWRKVAAARLIRDGFALSTEVGLALAPDVLSSLQFGDPGESA